MTARTFPATTFRRIVHSAVLSGLTIAVLLLLLTLPGHVPAVYFWFGIGVIAAHVLNVLDNVVAYGIAYGHNETVER